MSLAPLGRRAVTVTEYHRVGAYDVLAVADDGPLPDPGQFYMLAAAERWGGGADERPFLPRAFSVLRAARADAPGAAAPGGDLAGGTRREFMLEDVGPGTHRLGELRPGDALWLTGPFGNGFARPRDGRRPLLVGGGVGVAPTRSSCSGSATPRTPRARRCCTTPAWPPTTAPRATRAR